jgi:hypothetical protein
LPRPAEQPRSDSTLPHPELNPLVNPLLGQNMGRWAEVYFTSPPEKREEAVLNLLRELKENASGPRGSSGIQPRHVPQASETLEERPPQNFTPPEQTQGITQESALCQSCGSKNPWDQNFCGQCGSPLPNEPGKPAEAESDRHLWPLRAPLMNESAHYQSPYEYDPGETEGETTFAYESRRGLEGLRDVDGPQLMPVYEPVPYRYRIYGGAALAVLIAALVYIAWRGTQVPSANSRPLPQAASGATNQPPAQSQPSPSPVGGSSDKAGSLHDKADAAVSSDNEANKASHAATRIGNTTGTESPSKLATTSTSAPTERPATAASLQDNGVRELTLAEGYLNAAPGSVRDSTEAAKWLWQAVRKENAAATLLLSDLYLKGDGVPKSCDQGRLLLNAAARKGAPGAGERIRHLQAFGCQ